MLNINQHKFYLLQILKDIYSDIELLNCLGFKGGTALMFFYDLPRFSVDLDFNLLEIERQESVYNKVKDIVLRYGSIFDEAKKYYGPLIVLDYGSGERKLKLEISIRNFNDQYEIKNLLGINIKVMVIQDMFAHKLCALLDRNVIAGRDVFDTWFFMQGHTPLNKSIVEYRMKMPLNIYFDTCIDRIDAMDERKLLQGMGELMENTMKNFTRKKLKEEILSLMKFYKEYPILSS